MAEFGKIYNPNDIKQNVKWEELDDNLKPIQDPDDYGFLYKFDTKSQRQGSSQIPEASIVQNNVTLEGFASIPADLLPATDNTYDIGSAALSWKDVYAWNYYDENGNNLSDIYVNEVGDTMTGDLGFTNAGLNTADYAVFNTAYAETGGEAVGTTYWNSDDEVLSVKVTANVTTDLSQEIHFPVINQTGAQIDDGTPVMYAGTLGASGKLKIQKAIADGSIPSEYTMGIATEDIPNGDTGKVTWFGKVRGLDTTGTPYGEVWNDGDLIFISPTIAGNLTKVEPNAPNKRIQVAVIIKAHTNGILFLRPTWNSTLSDLDDVDGTPLTTDGQILVWDNVNKYFDPDYNITDYQTRLKNTTRVTAAYTALTTDEVIFANTDGGAFTLTLPAGVEGQHYRIINCGTSSNKLTIDGDGAELVKGSLTQYLIDGESLILTYNTTEGWY